ncbi:hypothetical protein A4S05_05230 [Nostoc sp. KVJ20]|nr:hypothetical protein A4S05_05230 [Nostoc sp. KVJ20]
MPFASDPRFFQKIGDLFVPFKIKYGKSIKLQYNNFGYDRFLRDIAGIGLQHEGSERVQTQLYIGYNPGDLYEQQAY